MSVATMPTQPTSAPSAPAGEPVSQLVDVSRLTAEHGVAKLIDHAAAMGASDLFFAANEQTMSILVRHLGIIKPISSLVPEHGRKLLSHIKAAAGMDLTEKRRPADGRWIYRRPEGDAVDLRINVIPTLYGEDFAIRLLMRGTRLYGLENLGLGRDQLSAFAHMISGPSGLILITGPTGSGKSATLYASLIRLNDGRRKINTIEDPIEFAIDGLRQSQVNPQISLNFAEMLRSVLRQSPDVIMLGEIRDEETARTAVHAANSGILVLATLHAPSAAGAIQSMRSLGVHSHFLSTCLRGIVAQRLVRTLCPACRQGFDLSLAPHTFDDVRPWLGVDEGNTLFAPKGCADCGMSGYAGRTGIFEVMPVSKSIRQLISDGALVKEIRDQAIEEKMAEFRQSAMLAVARGQTSTEEVFRVIPAEHLTSQE